MAAEDIPTSQFTVRGVDKASGFDTELVIDAASEENAKVKADMKGVVVTEVVALPTKSALTPSPSSHPVLPDPKEAKPIPKGWVPLTGDDANEWIKKIQSDRAPGFISDGNWYVPSNEIPYETWNWSKYTATSPTIDGYHSEDFRTVLESTDALLLAKILHRDIPATWRGETTLRDDWPGWHVNPDQVWSVFTHRSGYGHPAIFGHFSLSSKEGPLKDLGYKLVDIIHGSTKDEVLAKLATTEGIHIPPGHPWLVLTHPIYGQEFIEVRRGWLSLFNTSRPQSLEARGYKLVDIIHGRTKDEVLAKLATTEGTNMTALPGPQNSDASSKDPASGPRKRGLAIASLVCGIIGGIPILCIVAIPAIICGHIALVKINRDPDIHGGKGMAIAGLVLGYLGLALAVFIGIMRGILSAQIDRMM